ncbi:MAG: hypothetical protein OXG25_01930 [Gammaproteobacteria bacterium]|nr:hypothetical protein [Gammaproteobacteria bacterium]
MKFTRRKLYTIVTVFSTACIACGCSTIDPESHPAQISLSTDNVIEMECGERVLKIKTDDLTPAQKEELEELKTRCRIDNVAHKLETRSGLEQTETKHEIKAKRPAGR